MALLFHLKQKLVLGFAALWVRYPNKSAKKDAEKAFHQVVTTREIEDLVHQSLDWQLPHWATMEWYHPPYLATYLRKERFRDEPPAPKIVTINRPTATVRPLTAAQTKQQEANCKIVMLMEHGMSRADAVRQVSIEMGWIKTIEPSGKP